MTDREIMQQALDALLHMCNTTKAQNDYNAKIVDKALVTLETALAQPEQEEPLPLVDIGVDVTPEGTHVVACYNRPDAVQEMFYSQFHPLTKPEQEAVCDKDPFYCWSIRCQAGKVCKHTAPPRKGWVGLTDMDIHVLKMNHDKVKVVHTDRAEDLTVLGQDVDVNGLINAIQTKLKELNT